MYFVAGPVITARERKRTALFAHMLVGAVRSSSTFRLAGNNVEYLDESHRTARHPDPRHQHAVRAAAHSVVHRPFLGRRTRRDIWRRFRRQARASSSVSNVDRLGSDVLVAADGSPRIRNSRTDTERTAECKATRASASEWCGNSDGNSGTVPGPGVHTRPAVELRGPVGLAWGARTFVSRIETCFD